MKREDDWLARTIARVTRFSSRRCLWVLGAAVLCLGASAGYASRLQIRGNFVELLPTDDPTAVRFRQTRERKGGSGSTLMVIVQSPDPKSNERLIDELAARARRLPAALTEDVLSGPGEARDFVYRNRWLYAPVADLERIECELGRERARQMPGYFDLGECDDLGSWDDDAIAEEEATAKQDARAASKSDGTDDESPLERFREVMEKRVAKVDRFPSGYFRTQDGKSYALLIQSPAAGMGELSSDDLLSAAQVIVDEVDPKRFHDEMVVGFAGDIPNAIAERKALVHDVTRVSLVAVSLILGSIVLFFHSALSLVHIGFAVALGCGTAFSAAMAAFGHLNAATSFLGSIIAGNGINYSIVYFARYREVRRDATDVEEALVDAALTCRRGTWLAALAASGAYAALMLTSFRGFSEFGLIGGVGMVSCWAATFLVCPASITALERARERLGWPARGAVSGPARASWIAAVGALSVRRATPILCAAAVLAAAAATPLPGYLQDPWEYNFSNLRSRSSSQRGAGHFSRTANDIFQSRGSPLLLLASDQENALDVARQVQEHDQKLKGGHFVERVETIYDRLGGKPAEVKEKLELLTLIRKHIDAVLPRLSEEDRELALEWRPPERLRALEASALPGPLLEQFSESSGRIGTPVYVYLNRGVSQSRGENLLAITEILESVRLPDGSTAPNASRAAVFAAMIRSMERDGPRATLAAFAVVVAAALLVARRLAAVVAVVGSLLLGVLWTVGGAAWLGVRLNFLNFVALPLTFGIGVEYAINLYDRVRYSGGMITAGLRSAGGPVALCSLTTILGYGSLLFADNRALQSFGQYAIFGEIACIATALLVLPATLSLLGSGSLGSGGPEEPASPPT